MRTPPTPNLSAPNEHYQRQPGIDKPGNYSVNHLDGERKNTGYKRDCQQAREDVGSHMPPVVNIKFHNSHSKYSVMSSVVVIASL